MIAAGAYRPTAAVAQKRKGCGGMATARIRAAFDCPIETVWAVVTSLGDISMRGNHDDFLDGLVPMTFYNVKI